MGKLEFILPFPPPLNQYYRAIKRGKHACNILGAKARAYPGLVKEAIGFWPHDPVKGIVHVDLLLCMPDRRRRDVDNYIKGVFDALTKARIWEDDAQVSVLRVQKVERDDQSDQDKPGTVWVTIYSFEKEGDD